MHLMRTAGALSAPIRCRTPYRLLEAIRRTETLADDAAAVKIAVPTQLGSAA